MVKKIIQPAFYSSNGFLARVIDRNNFGMIVTWGETVREMDGDASILVDAEKR